MEAWERLAREASNALLRCEERSQATDAKIDRLEGRVLRAIGLIESHVQNHAGGGNLEELEIITQHGTRRAPTSFEEWNTYQEAATWKGLKRWGSGVAKIVVGGVLLVVVTAVATLAIRDYAAHLASAPASVGK